MKNRAALPLTRTGNMETKEQIREFIAHNFYVAELSQLDDEASLIETGVIDSTGVLEVVAFLEQDFGIVVADEDILPDNLDSIARMAAYVSRQQGAAS